MKNKRLVLIYIPFAVLLLLVAFITGAQVGINQFYNMDSSSKAMLLIGELNVIRAGNTQKLIEGKEISLDGEIVRAVEFQESGHSWMFFPFAQSYDHEKYLSAVAYYRQKHYSPTSKLTFEGGNERHQNQMKSYQLEVAKRNKHLLERYGK